MSPLAIERIARIRALAAEGHSQATIAGIEGISRERVRQLCNREGIETLSGRIDHDLREAIAAAVAEGLTLDKIAERCGRDYSVVRMNLKAMGLASAKHRRLADDIRGCIAEGLALSETARKLGKPVQSIWDAANSAGLKFEKKLRPCSARPDCNRVSRRKPRPKREGDCPAPLTLAAEYQAGGVSYSDLAAKYGVSRSAVAGAIYRAKGAPA